MPRKILVIDDEPGIREVIALHLSSAGFDVTEAGSIKSGLEKLDAESFVLVICDLTLPDMRGAKVVSEVRAKAPEVPVVAISGYVDDPLEDEVKRAGAGELLRKPFLKEALLSAVERHLTR